MNYFLRLFFLVLLGGSLCACSTLKNSQTFRNRTFDYERQAVVNLPPLKTPSDLPTPDFSPALQIPPGQNDYPTGHFPTMTPPGFNDNIPIPVLPPKSNALTGSNS